jgi:arylsulfatase A-like enzyme
MNWVREKGLEKNTMLVYMGDNGFSFGEHGLIDKRHAYEESMRVPLLVWAPGMVKPRSVVDQVIMNVDLAPSFLELAGVKKPEQMQGYSFIDVLKGKPQGWQRDKVFYEYYWESAFPQTPTTFAIRTSQYKYIFYHGVWDINELYDLQADPYEMNNLVRNPAFKEIGMQLKKELFEWINKTGGENIPLKRPVNTRFDNRYRNSY